MAARWLLWVDGVGGYLMLPGDDWTIGGPGTSWGPGASWGPANSWGQGNSWGTGGSGEMGPAEEAEICVQGDLSAREACLRRLGGDYVLQPFAAALLGDRRMHRPTPLRDGDRFTFATRAASLRLAAERGGAAAGNAAAGGVEAAGVRFSFAKPHPLSSSARLTLVSRHRLRPRCDAIILLADTCILGPSRTSHVVAAAAESEVVLLFSAGRWWCRGMGETNVDGEPREGRFELVPGTRVESGGIAFSLEAV